MRHVLFFGQPRSSIVRPVRSFYHNQRHNRVPLRRHASTTQHAQARAASTATRAKNFVSGTLICVAGVFSYFYITDTRAGVHQWLSVPSLRWLYPDAEDAHHAGVKLLQTLYSFGLYPRERSDPDKTGDLSIEVDWLSLLLCWPWPPLQGVLIVAGLRSHSLLTSWYFSWS